MRSLQTFSGLFLAALLVNPHFAGAEEAPPVRANLGFASRYVVRGLERAGASTQATFELSRDNLRGGFWANVPFAGGVGREVSLSAAYVWPTAAGMTVEASMRTSWLDRKVVTGADSSLEFGLVATLAPVDGFTPGFSYYHDFRFQSDTAQVSVARSIALTGFGAFLDLNLFGGLSSGSDWRPDAPGAGRHDSYSYWGAEAQVPYRFGPHSTLVAGLHYADSTGRSPTNGPFSLSDGQKFWVTLGVSLDF